MAFLKFNKAELVNLSYSLKREILLANKVGAYCNTTIVTCNTRKYHGLLAVTLDRFGGRKYLLLSALDESLIVNGKQFNLGIHRYGGIYEPRGHKYVVDFVADPVPQITYKVGQIVFRKSLLLAPDKDQLLVRYELLESPAKAVLRIKPFLAFRNIHELTHQNADADLGYREIDSGVSFRMYSSFPDLHLQLSDPKSRFIPAAYWNNDITYIEEYRRGFDCTEDLYTPGNFEVELKAGGSVVLSASKSQENHAALKRSYNRYAAGMSEVSNNRDQLVRCADLLIQNHNNRKKINAGFTWLYSGLLRETLQTLPGLTLYGLHSPAQFEEILDNLIADEQERLLRRTTQVEAPLYLSSILQAYVEYGADARKVWNKYGRTVKAILESYLPGVRNEVTMHPNGLLWAQQDGVALTWMNAYVGGRALTERAGYQVETNAFWYNSICYAIEMESASSGPDRAFIDKWSRIRDMVKASFMPVFWYGTGRYLADYVDNCGQHTEVRPNQLYAIWVKYSPVDDEYKPFIFRVIDSELVTPRGIRTLSPRDPGYKCVYDGNQIERDNAYQQGSAWPFLLEQFVSVGFNIKGQAFWKRAEWLSEGFYADLGKHGVGAFSEIYDGDPPQEPHGAISSALSTAALLAVDYYMEKNREEVK